MLVSIQIASVIVHLNLLIKCDASEQSAPLDNRTMVIDSDIDGHDCPNNLCRPQLIYDSLVFRILTFREFSHDSRLLKEYTVYKYQDDVSNESDIGLISFKNTLSSTKIINDYHLGMSYVIKAKCSVEPIPAENPNLRLSESNLKEFLWLDEPFICLGKYNNSILASLSSCRPSKELIEDAELVTEMWKSYKKGLNETIETTMFITRKVNEDNETIINSESHVFFKRQVSNETSIIERCFTHQSQIENYRNLLNTENCFNSSGQSVTLQLKFEPTVEEEVTFLCPKTGPHPNQQLFESTLRTVVWKHFNLSLLRIGKVDYRCNNRTLTVSFDIKSMNPIDLLGENIYISNRFIDGMHDNEFILPKEDCLRHLKVKSIEAIIYCGSTSGSLACFKKRFNDNFPFATASGVSCSLYSHEHIVKLENVLKESSTSKLLSLTPKPIQFVIQLAQVKYESLFAYVYQNVSANDKRLRLYEREERDSSFIWELVIRSFAIIFICILMCLSFFKYKALKRRAELNKSRTSFHLTKQNYEHCSEL